MGCGVLVACIVIGRVHGTGSPNKTLTCRFLLRVPFVVRLDKLIIYHRVYSTTRPADGT